MSKRAPISTNVDMFQYVLRSKQFYNLNLWFKINPSFKSLVITEMCQWINCRWLAIKYVRAFS